MTQEEKQELLIALCGHLQYGVKISKSLKDEIWEADFNMDMLTLVDNGWLPYLRPMSSMTEEEKEEYCKFQDRFLYSSQYPVTDAYEIFDWLNEHHFDYRGLIPKGLALEAPKGMYNIYNIKTE